MLFSSDKTTYLTCRNNNDVFVLAECLINIEFKSSTIILIMSVKYYLDVLTLRLCIRMESHGYCIYCNIGFQFNH